MFCANYKDTVRYRSGQINMHVYIMQKYKLLYMAVYGITFSPILMYCSQQISKCIYMYCMYIE